jgi:sugar-phosphatase
LVTTLPCFAVLICRAILFDLDGVLVDSEQVVERTWHRWARRHKLDIPDLVTRAHGRRSIETVREVAPQLDAEAEARWLESLELADAEGLIALPGAAAFFSAIPPEQLAVVTSCGRALARFRLDACGYSIPDVLVSADDVSQGKPAPDGYVLAARRLGFKSVDCVVIEDTPAGIAAGRAAGATVIAVATTFPRAELSEAHEVIASLAHVTMAQDQNRLRLHLRLDPP